MNTKRTKEITTLTIEKAGQADFHSWVGFQHLLKW